MKKISTTLVFLVMSIVILIIAVAYCISSQRKVPQEPAPLRVSWSYQTREEEGSEPKTTVTAQIGNKKYKLREYAGTCSDRPIEDREEGEISGIRCWFAGGGDDIGVFGSGDSLVIKHRIVEEGAPDDGGGFVGKFETLFTVDSLAEEK